MPKRERRQERQKTGLFRNIRGYTDGGGSALVHIHRPPGGTGMLNAKCIAILGMYAQTLGKEDPEFHTDREYAKSTGHLQSMIPKAIVFFQEGRREKGFRWLGFIQGVLWAEGIYSIEELKEHNRPDRGEEKDEEEE